MDNGMNLSGQLADWTMDDLLQIVQVTKKTGSMDIFGAHKGRVHFREGSITGAELHSSKGVYAGTDAATIADVVFVLGSMQEGGFAMGPADGPDVDGVPIESITEEIGELRGLEAVVLEKGLIGEGEVMLKRVLEEDVTISPEDWAAITSLVQPFTFESLEERRGRGAAIRMVHAFHRLGVVDAFENGEADQDVDQVSAEVTEEESNWLDRLADEVSSTDSTKWLDEAVEEITGGDDEGLVADAATHSQLVIAPDENADDHETPNRDETPEINRMAKIGIETRGLSAPASTTLTNGVYDDIRRLRSKVAE